MWILLALWTQSWYKNLKEGFLVHRLIIKLGLESLQPQKKKSFCPSVFFPAFLQTAVINKPIPTLFENACIGNPITMFFKNTGTVSQKELG